MLNGLIRFKQILLLPLAVIVMFVVPALAASVLAFDYADRNSLDDPAIGLAPLAQAQTQELEVFIIIAPSEPVNINQSLSFTAVFTDPEISFPHTAVWDWGDGSGCDTTTTTSSECFLEEDDEEESGDVFGSHTYNAPGIYTVLLTVTADDGASGEASSPPVVVEPGVTLVALDIKPGSDPNSINCQNEKGVITVAVLTTADFDALVVDPNTVTFEGASETHVDKKSGEPRRHEENVDDDDDVDLVFHFRLGDTDLMCDSTEGTLTGETFNGIAIEGTDAVRMVN